MQTHRLRRLSAIGVLTAAALSLSQPTAHADGTRTASASGTGTSYSAGETNARNNARFALAWQASQAGEMCTNVSATATHVYTAPDGSAYVFQGTATGYCAVSPPYTVHRTATRQYSASTAPVAYATADQLARNDVLAAGINCTNWLGSSKLVYAAPARDWFTYEVTQTALCTN